MGIVGRELLSVFSPFSMRTKDCHPFTSPVPALERVSTGSSLWISLS